MVFLTFHIFPYFAIFRPYSFHLPPNNDGKHSVFICFWVRFQLLGKLDGWSWQLPTLNLEECRASPIPLKSAHTALAVKACLLGGNSYTKCSITFVNIAVAISALAGGGQKRFRTETRIGWCFRHFSRIFGCLSARGYWNGILGHFGSFPAMEKRPKMKKTLYIARFCRVFGCQSIENTAKTSVLDWRYSKKRVNYRMLDWKHYKNTVKSNVLEGFTAFMAKNV